MSLKKVYILLITLFTIQSAMAQIEFTTKTSKNKLGVNQRLRIEFSINKQGADNFTPPDFKNFKVVAGPSQSVNQSWINGKSSFTQSYIYIIEPKTEGTLTVKPATIDYDGEKLYSNEVKIIVTSAINTPKDPNDPSYIAKENIHLVAEVSKSNPYVGEGIYVVYKLYVSENISVNNWRVSENPQYNGFWNQDIEVKDIKVKMGKYNGENYRYIVLKKAVLIPQKAGKLEVEPMKMDFTVGVPTGRGDFFGNPITKNVSYSSSSGKRIVNVKQLPLEGKPENFDGAVGDFDFKVLSSKNALKANESAQIKVEVSGTGNLKLFELPKITTPPELEVYTPEHKEQVVTTLNGLRGQITDSYTVVPQYRGKYKIPEISFSYFNPSEKEYKTITVDPIIVDVLEGKELPTTSVNQHTKQDVVANANNFRFISLKTDFIPIKNTDFFKSNLFYSLLLLPFLAIPLAIVIGAKKKQRDEDIFGNKIRKANKLAKKYLSEAKKQLGKKEAFYIALEKALHNFLKAKLHVETSEISKDKIADILSEKNVNDGTIKEFLAVLNDCDFARYTPTTNVMMKEEYNKAVAVLTKIDKQL